jgi:type IV secretory pathway VirB3-like protein
MDGGEDKPTQNESQTTAGEQLHVLDKEKPAETVTNKDVNDNGAVTWEASEFIKHQKTANWYIGLTVSVVLLGVLIYLVIKDIWSLIVLVVMYAAIVVYAGREPRTLRYGINDDGITIGERHFDFGKFRSFSVIEETGIPSISLDPTQRFMPPISIYFAPDDSDRVFDALSRFLPYEQKPFNLIDRLMLKLRF